MTQSNDPFDPLNPVTASHLLRRLDDERMRDMQNRYDSIEGKIELTDAKVTDLAGKFQRHDSEEREYREQIMGLIATQKGVVSISKVIAWFVVIGSAVASLVTWIRAH